MARVMTIQEVFNSTHTVMCEFRYGIEPQRFQLKDIVRWLSQKRKYEKTWRCWSAKPTDEERKMVKWK